MPTQLDGSLCTQQGVHLYTKLLACMCLKPLFLQTKQRGQTNGSEGITFLTIEGLSKLLRYMGVLS